MTSQKLTERLTILLTPREKMILEKMVEKSHETQLSTWARKKLLDTQITKLVRWGILDPDNSWVKEKIEEGY